MKRFPLPKPSKNAPGVRAAFVVEPCYYYRSILDRKALLADKFVASAVVGAGKAGWKENQVKILDANELQKLCVRISDTKGATFIYTNSVSLLLWASSLHGELAKNGWTCDWVFSGGKAEILRLNRGHGKACVTFQSIHTVDPGYNTNPERVEAHKMRMSSLNHLEDGAQLYARAEADAMSEIARCWFGMTASFSSVPGGGTIGAQAWNDWRNMEGIEDTCYVYLNDELRSYCRKAYVGGLVRAFQVGDFTGSYSMVDVRSAYPFVMRNRNYPSTLHAWVYDLELEKAEEWLRKGCIIAEVEVDTDEAIYPVRRGGSIEYPLGRFNTTIASGSLSYALERGHVDHIHTAALWRSCRPFKAWVDYWIGIRDYYNLNDWPTEARLCKLLMNSLYGRLGMRVSKPLIEEERPALETGYQNSAIALEDLPANVHVATPSGGHVELEGKQYTACHDITVLGKRTCSVEGVEAPLAMPHLSAHVTDYGRILLWRKLCQLGLDDVLYADTDSAIIPSRLVPRSMRQARLPQLGQWSVREEGERVQVFGEKCYALDGHMIASGLPVAAVETSAYEWEAPQVPGLLELLSGEQGQGIEISSKTFSIDPGGEAQHIVEFPARSRSA